MCFFTFLLLCSLCFGARLTPGLFSLTLLVLSDEKLDITQIAGVGVMETISGDVALALVLCGDVEKSGRGFTALW